ncbi:fatty acid desaturase [Aminobacter sp. MSH1]|uniref:fatty acid desaturase n=1 Tax=Aminobacter sp. MSH1 TaxID=374606 RepID=UPI00131EEFF4|nr:fatty acid desaturase [Aminobacter sp. MSH1]
MSDFQPTSTGLPDWHVCDVPKKQLRELMKRNDRVGLVWLAGHFGLLLAVGCLAYASLGTWWMIPAFVAYGSIYTFAVSILHETHHGTPFRSRLINEIVHTIAGYMVLKEPVYDRWSHTNHHSFTIYPDIDLEILCPRPTAKRPYPWIRMVVDLTRLVYMRMSIPKPIFHAFGSFSPKTREIVPETEFSKLKWSSRGFLLYYSLIVALALFTQSWLPLVYTVGAQIYGAVLFVLIGYTQHAGLEENAVDHRMNTRTMYLNPLLRFLYWNMNYHIEHHMFPMIPFYNLPKLHRLIKHQLPRSNNGLLDAYSEIIPALIKQQRDPSYYLRPELPKGSEHRSVQAQATVA